MKTSVSQIISDHATVAEANRVLRVLWLVDHLGHDGFLHGAGRYYMNVIPHFNPSTVAPTLCVIKRRDAATEMFEKQGIRVRHLGRGRFDLRALADVVRLVRRDNIDLIHAHGYGSNNIARVVGGACRVPVVIHSHDDDRNYPWYQRIADILLCPLTSRAIAVSQAVQVSLVNKRRVRSIRTCVLHNGIPLKQFVEPEPAAVNRERTRLKIPAKAKVIGAVGRLREEKGMRFLIEAAPAVLKRVPSALLLIVGDGPLRAELERLSRELGVADRVRFIGFRKDVQVMLAIMDVLVVPSLTEGFGLALLEGMALRKPIVASKVGAIPEIISDGHNGVLAPAGDPNAIAEKIVNLLESEEESRRLASNAFESAQNYEVSAHVRNLEQIYRQTLFPV
jgi:glycosyltransferase involved in cell wall biosynthesis